MSQLGGGVKKLRKLVIYRGVCRERFRCLRATHLRISPGLYDVSVHGFQSFRGSQLWREMWRATPGCRMESLLSHRIAHFSSHFAGFLPTVDRSSAVALALYFN